MPTTFGIEEELMLVDPTTLRPRAAARPAIRALQQELGTASVSAEFLPCQLEHATAVHTSADAAFDGLRRFRSAVGRWSAAHGLLPVFSGTPPRLPTSVEPIRGARYRRIADDTGALAQEHYVNGTHVHVGVADAEDRVRVSNGLREWLPLLIALSANSPIWAGFDTGHLSWRAVQMRRWTTNGIPPVYADWAEHHELSARIRGLGATRRISEISWGVRLSAHYPTVEVRVCDSQLRAADAVGIADLLVGVTDHLLAAPASPTPHHVLDAELWHAARFGLAHGVHDPLRGTHRPAEDVLSGIRRTLDPGAYAEELLMNAQAGAQGAQRQRHALNRAALNRLYAASVDDTHRVAEAAQAI